MLSSLTLTSISTAQLTEVKHYRLLRNWVMVNQNYFPNSEIKDGAVFQRQGSMSSICGTILCCWYWVEKSLQMEFILPEFRHQNVSCEIGLVCVEWNIVTGKRQPVQGDSPYANHPCYTCLSVLTKEKIWMTSSSTTWSKWSEINTEFSVFNVWNCP